MIDTELRAQLMEVSFPTLGHLLEDGFCAPDIRLLTPAATMVGIAATARVVGNDAATVNEALERLRSGEVLFLEMVDDHAHAPIGAVTRATAVARGAAGIVVDGPVTDIEVLGESPVDGSALAIYGRGTTCLTTKLHGAGGGAVQVPVVVGGASVSPGDIALGDRNGVVVLPPRVLEEVLPAVLQSDRAEPALIEALENRIRAERNV
jgi:4-hydroxy-4-methyl-2-oxoglutarate aldolase